jgi:hypothetical protein
MCEIRLRDEEIQAATQVAVLRVVNSLDRQNTTKGLPRYSFDIDVLGALGEMAVARYLGYGSELSVDTFKDIPDVGKFEVRATQYENGHLILRKGDPGDRAYILVTGGPRLWHLRGWLMGEDAFAPQYERDPGGRGTCWMVPQSDLNRMRKLPK